MNIIKDIEDTPKDIKDCEFEQSYRRGYHQGYDNAFDDIFFFNQKKHSIIKFINKTLIPWRYFKGKYGKDRMSLAPRIYTGNRKDFESKLTEGRSNGRETDR